MIGPKLKTARVLVCAAVVLLIFVAGPVRSPAQTGGSDLEPCIPDRVLPLAVPDAAQIEFNLQSTLRGPGMLISWPDVDPALSTCTALLDTAGLGFSIEVEGAYTDVFDRRLNFRFDAPGTIGDPANNTFLCVWNNVNVALSGSYSGTINLSNTGGLWVRAGGDGSGDSWRQQNAGLPVHSLYTNLVDLAVSSDGQTMLTGLTAGVDFTIGPRGLFRSEDGGPWQAIRPDVFGRHRIITKVAMSPHDPGHFAVGTRTAGVFVTTDGGQTFTQWTRNLDPDFGQQLSQFRVTAMAWDADRLHVAVRYYGLFHARSDDPHDGFERLANLHFGLDAQGNPIIPQVHCMVIDPSDNDRIVVGLESEVAAQASQNGAYRSLDGGQSWQSLHTTFVGLPSGSGGVTNPNARKIVRSLAIDPDDDQVMWMGTGSQGLWRTTDGGDAWHEVASPFLAPSNQPTVIDMTRHEGILYAQVLPLGTQIWGLHEWSDDDQQWRTLDVAANEQPFNRRARRILSTEAGLLLPTSGGGIYVPGAPFSISSTIATWPLPIEFGLSLRFFEGGVDLELDPEGSYIPRSFGLLAQNHQGWVVWRSDDSDPDNMAMIGRFDMLNPETCIEGFCGDESYVIDPRCFSERLAACFDFSVPGTISFYDDNIFNGFVYHYAVTTFDYGDISMLTSPISLSAPMVFPPRFPGDPLASARCEGDDLPLGAGNRQSIQINVEAAPPLDGKQVYVFPNPLRLGRGIAGGEGEEVCWTNLPPDSRIQVFTLAGDHIADLPEPDRPQQGGNIFWNTRNKEGQRLFAGIYMWKLIMPQRGDYWGKLVIIR